MAVADDWSDWPTLPELFPISYPGIKTSRDPFLVDADETKLRTRISDYFDPNKRHEEIAQRHPVVMKSTRIFDASKGRQALLKRGGPIESGFHAPRLSAIRYPVALLGRWKRTS